MITVTITNELTIIDGPTTVYRYDHPDAAELAEFILSLDDDELHIEGDQSSINALTAALAGSDIDITTEAFAETPTEIIERPELPRRNPIPAVVAATALAVFALGGLAAWRTSGHEEASISMSSTSEVASSAPQSAPQFSTQPSTQSGPQKVVLTQAGLSVELPAGFSLEADEDMWRATGADPDFRLQLAVDELYGLPPEAMLEQIQREIDSDPTLAPLSRDGNSMHYQQKLDDGSEVHWHTWAQADYQLSLGCHTRFAPTRTQLATCQMATDTARFTPP